ncbi:MAG TPA: NYN domain-containing protein [Bacteroidia bacterium]|nr:NYN domain-containing protein [Bacteroidia bacterium]
MSTPDDSIALLIDADNSPAAKIGFIMTELATYGVANIRRAYGNWTKSALGGWAAVLHEHAIEPVQLFDLVKGKNGTDMRLLIDAMDILYTKSVQTFALVSSDCDFTPLCTRLRAEGKKVIGFGGQNTPSPFIDSCTKFLYLDDDESAAAIRKEQRTSGKKLKSNTKLLNTLRSAIEACADEDGWASLDQVGNHISNQSSLDHRTFGFAKLSGLFGAIDLFDLERSVHGGTAVYRVRQRPKGTAPRHPEISR